MEGPGVPGPPSLLKNRSMFLSLNRSLFLTFAPVSAHLKYHEVSSKMADSQLIQLSCKEVSAYQD